MTRYYRLSNPSDVREIDAATFAAWEQTGNPKRLQWAPQPVAPSPDAEWLSGAWVVPPPPPPTADWSRFKLALLPDPTAPNNPASAINLAITQAFAAVPVGVLGLSSGLAKAEAGDYQEFSGSWRAVLAVAPPPADALAELVALAGDCNLPSEFVGAVAGQRVRARDSQGRFLPDDPATPDVDEAWV
jgi:hypothetical protein